jgi:hypothetical protein
MKNWGAIAVLALLTAGCSAPAKTAEPSPTAPAVRQVAGVFSLSASAEMTGYRASKTACTLTDQGRLGLSGIALNSPDGRPTLVELRPPAGSSAIEGRMVDGRCQVNFRASDVPDVPGTYTFTNARGNTIASVNSGQLSGATIPMFD